MSNPIYRSGKVIAEMIEMNKVIAVSALAMAGMFSTQALADESKTGFYVTGKDRKSTRLNSSHASKSRMPSSA